MSQRTQVQEQTPLCKPSKALISLLSGYEKTQINDAFYDMEEVVKQWLESDYANDKDTRGNMLFSLSIISKFGVIVKAIPKKKLKQLYKQMCLEQLAIKEAQK